MKALLTALFISSPLALGACGSSDTGSPLPEPSEPQPITQEAINYMENSARLAAEHMAVGYYTVEYNESLPPNIYGQARGTSTWINSKLIPDWEEITRTVCHEMVHVGQYLYGTSAYWDFEPEYVDRWFEIEAKSYELTCAKHVLGYELPVTYEDIYFQAKLQRLPVSESRHVLYWPEYYVTGIMFDAPLRPEVIHYE